MEVLNSCGTLRRVDNPDERLREARDKGCTIWLLLDPGCRKEALARLYEHEPYAEKTILFLDTALEESSEVSPWLAPLSRDSPMERWISGANPPGWGLYLASDAPFDEMLAHLRGLVLAKRDGEKIVFRFWDGRPLTRICQDIPEDIAMLLGPIRRILTQDEGGGWVCIDRDGDAFMTEAHRPRPALPSPWYAFTDRHDRLFHDKRPGIVARNITESLFHEKMERGLALPPSEALSAFVARHVNRGLALSPLARTPLDEDAAVAAMRNVYNPGDTHV